MDKKQAVTYLRFSGFSDEQIKVIEEAFSCPSMGIDCEDCPAYEKKSEWEHDHEILRAYSDGASAVLDEIRAEIWDLQYGDEEKSMTDEDRVDAYNNAIKQVIEIIDKYKEEGSEE